MSDYERGICCICRTPITIESGCAPVCDMAGCGEKYDEEILRIEQLAADAECIVSDPVSRAAGYRQREAGKQCKCKGGNQLPCADVSCFLQPT